MNHVRQSYIYLVFALKEYITCIFGYHYPREIINLIIMSTYKSVKIMCGSDKTFIISGTDVYTWGCDDSGEISKKLWHLPRKIPILNIITVSCGMYHTVALTKDAELYIWGDNYYGQLGTIKDDDDDNQPCAYYPHEHFLKNVQIISCGTHHTIVVTQAKSETSQKIYGWGNNDWGQLGLGDRACYSSIPHEVILPLHSGYYKQVNCGTHHTVILIKNTIYVCGSNKYGQLGLGSDMYKNSLQELNLPNVISIGCGLFHTVALVKSTNLNQLYVWGNNNRGQLGLGDYNHRFSPQEVIFESVVSVSCGGTHTIALTLDGLVYVWGDNSSGQLGSGCKLNLNQNVPHKFIFHEPIYQVSCGGAYTMVVTKLGKIYGWGCNDKGQLGLADYADQYSPQELVF